GRNPLSDPAGSFGVGPKCVSHDRSAGDLPDRPAGQGGAPLGRPVRPRGAGLPRGVRRRAGGIAPVASSLGIPIALAAGVLSFLSPCVLPLVPSYLSFVTGMNLGELEEGESRGRVLLHAGLFVSGFTAVFVALGASASFLGQFVRAYEIWVARAGGVLLVVFGLHLLGL